MCRIEIPENRNFHYIGRHYPHGESSSVRWNLCQITLGIYCDQCEMSSTKRTSLALKDSSSLPSTSFQRHSASNTLSSWLRHLHPGQSLSDLLSAVFWRDVAVEFLVCMVVECCVVWVLTTLRLDMYQPSTTHIGLFAAFLVFAVVEGYGPVSGAPVNPACCWGFFLARRMSAARSMQ